MVIWPFQTTNISGLAANKHYRRNLAASATCLMQLVTPFRLQVRPYLNTHLYPTCFSFSSSSLPRPPPAFSSRPAAATLLTMECLPDADNTFGPQYCNHFDFTLLFEQSFFQIAPCALLLLLLPLYASQLRRQNVKTLHTSIQTAKQSSILLLAAT